MSSGDALTANTASESEFDPRGARSFSPPTAAVSAASAADLELLAERLGAHCLARDDGSGEREPTMLLAREGLLKAAEYLRAERGYVFLRSVTGVDYLPSEPRFQVVYHLTAIPAGVLAGDPKALPEDPTRLLCLKVPLAADDAVLPSLCGIYPTANFHERETYDLFGIEFAGHPDLRRILMPNDYEGFPLRKDHPQVYEEIAFSFNQDAIYARKPFAKE
jgi:NADH-quinone oxidoreductase subunit C